MTKWLFVAGGGALGSALRYAVQLAFHRATAGSFPIGTLLVNVIGCAVIGFLAALFAPPTIVREEVRLGLSVGLLGGFTTFSAFGLETFALANEGFWRTAAANVILSCTLGLAGVWVGYRVAERLFGG